LRQTKVSAALNVIAYGNEYPEDFDF